MSHKCPGCQSRVDYPPKGPDKCTHCGYDIAHWKKQRDIGLADKLGLDEDDIDPEGLK